MKLEQVALFLGAGASVDFGIPAARQMTQKFIGSHPEHRDRVDRIKAYLTRLGFAFNIENILSFARGQANPKEVLLNSSPYVSYFCKEDQGKLGYDPSARRIINDIQEFIADRCLVREADKVQKIRGVYSRFLRILFRRFEIPGELKDGSTAIDIFTTNYDNVIERYAYSEGIDLYDGYEATGDGSSRFAPHLYESQGTIRLYKLHGSVTHGRAEHQSTGREGVVEDINGFALGDAFHRYWKIVGRVMVHGYEKDPSKGPFHDLLSLLRRTLENVSSAVVIGYSFSDRPILNAFNDALDSQGSSLELMLINKNARKIKKSLFPKEGRVHVRNVSFNECSML